MFSPKQWLACGLIILGATACRTTQKPTLSALPELPPPTTAPLHEATPPPAPSVTAAAPTPSPPPPPAPVPVPEWVAWEEWCQQNNGSPFPSSGSPTHSGQGDRTSSGVFAIQIGSRLASCDGVGLWLGFAPKLINGQPHIQRLDAQKSFLPLLQQAPVTAESHRMVVIDPGHGGQDNGTRSVVDHRLEKDFTLDWALRAKPLLEARGWTVLLTRTNDIDVALADRVAFAEQHQADLFLSLHFNSAFPSRNADGIETYCLTPTGMPSQLVRDDGDDTLQVHPNNSFDEANLRLAFRVHRALLAATGGTDRGVRRARFMGVLKGQNRPAALVEAGFLSNPKEAALIGATEYRQRLAEALAKALE